MMKKVVRINGVHGICPSIYAVYEGKKLLALFETRKQAEAYAKA